MRDVLDEMSLNGVRPDRFILQTGGWLAGQATGRQPCGGRAGVGHQHFHRANARTMLGAVNRHSLPSSSPDPLSPTPMQASFRA